MHFLFIYLFTVLCLFFHIWHCPVVHCLVLYRVAVCPIVPYAPVPSPAAVVQEFRRVPLNTWETIKPGAQTHKELSL